jgi:hypothetical protein
MGSSNTFQVGSALWAVVLPIFMSGCDSSSLLSGNTSKKGRYELSVAADSQAYRLDSVTGEVYAITPKAMTKVVAAHPVLQIGEYYEMPDAKGKDKYLKYLGEGRFQKMEELAALLEMYGTKPDEPHNVLK